MGAIAPLLIGIALLDLGDAMPRILFAQLLVVALITWALRQGMVESQVWKDAQDKAGQAAGAFKELFRHTKALVFLIVMDGVWNLVAGTYGFFFPYILEAVGNTSERANYTVQAILLLPTVQDAGFRTLSIVLALMLIVSGVVGIIFAPRGHAREFGDAE